MANWVCRSFESLYKPYAKHRRAAYYELINGRLLRNSAYRQVPEIRVAYPVEMPDADRQSKNRCASLSKSRLSSSFNGARKAHRPLSRTLSITFAPPVLMIPTCCGVRSSPSLSLPRVIDKTRLSLRSLG
jgi:hypothetical protein